MGTELNWKPGPDWARWTFKNSALWKFQPMLCSASSWDSLFSMGNFLKYYCSLFYIFCCCFLFQLTETSVSVNSRVCSRLCMPVWLQPANSFAYIPEGRSSYLSPCYLLPLNPSLNVCIFQPESRITLKFKPYLQEELSPPKVPAKFGALLYSLLSK